MQSTDMAEFCSMLDSVCSLLSRGAYQPTAANTAIFFRALARFSIAEVRAGFDAHVSDPQRGRFVPVPADVIAQIEAMAHQDGRPGAEEAWALAVRSSDEAETVVWTAEIAEAYGIALPILTMGDEVGARMAFREAYERLIGEARRESRRANWTASLGHDTERRDKVIAAAVEAGQLPYDQFPALPAPRGPVMLLGAPTSGGIPPEARAALMALRDWLTSPAEYESDDAIARERTDQLKAQAAAKVASYSVPVPVHAPVKHWMEVDDEELEK